MQESSAASQETEWMCTKSRIGYMCSTNQILYTSLWENSLTLIHFRGHANIVCMSNEVLIGDE